MLSEISCLKLADSNMLWDIMPHGLSETRQTRSWRRLYWSCYVQDSLSRLMHCCKPISPDLRTPVPLISLDDFDFDCYDLEDGQNGPALPQDVLAQVNMVKLFKFEVELCVHLDEERESSLQSFAALSDRMRLWLVELKRGNFSASASPEATHCLNLQWETVRILQSTVALVRWERHSQKTGLDMIIGSEVMTCFNYIGRLKNALASLHVAKQLRHMPHRASWAFNAATETIAKMVDTNNTAHSNYFTSIINSLESLQSGYLKWHAEGGERSMARNETVMRLAADRTAMSNLSVASTPSIGDLVSFDWSEGEELQTPSLDEDGHLTSTEDVEEDSTPAQDESEKRLLLLLSSDTYPEMDSPCVQETFLTPSPSCGMGEDLDILQSAQEQGSIDEVGRMF